MYKNKRILGLIPARGGSKGLPNKNIRPLLGKPLIAWTIEQALKSKYLDRIIVSTEDKKIAKISKEYGAEVPFIRPERLATDDAKTVDVVKHAIMWFVNHKIDSFEYIVVLQPTSPLRQSKDIDSAIEYLFKRKARAVISVCQAEHSPLWSNTLPVDLCMKNFLKKDILNKNRQQLPIFYRLNGAIYLVEVDYFLKTGSFYGEYTYAYIMPKWRSVDIDDEFDFFIAECIIKYYNRRKKSRKTSGV